MSFHHSLRVMINIDVLISCNCYVLYKSRVGKEDWKEDVTAVN